MEITQAVGDAEKLRTELLVIGIFAGEPLRGAAQAVDHLTNGRLSHIVRRGEIGSAPGATLLVRDLPGAAAVRILLVSLGSAASFSDEAYRKVLEATARALGEGVASEAVVTLVENLVPGRSLAWSVQQAGRFLADDNHRIVLPGSQSSSWDRNARGARSIMLLIPTTLTSELVGALRRGLAVAEGIALSKDLDDLGGQLPTTSALANAAKAMGEEFRFPVEVLERNPLRTIGRQTPPSAGETPANAKMIVMHYKGRRAKNRPIVLAGAGTPVTLNGASSVLGALEAVARLRLPINVIGLVTAAGCAKRGNVCPSDPDVTLVSSREIDARDRPFELRSGLRDMFTYAERFVPSTVIGIATLAASVAAVGARNLYANDNTLAAELLKSSEESGGRAWRLHLWDDRTDRIESYRASTGDVDAMRAASLLRCSAKTYSWGYLDIEETASGAVQPENKVDCLVALLADFLINRAAEAALSMPEARGGRKTHNRGVVL